MNRKIAFSQFLSVVKTLGLVAGGLLLVAPLSSISAQESEATNQQPVIKSPRVAKSLLQDIVRIGDRLVVVGERGHIAYSEDNGKTWQQADDPTRAMLNAVFFISPEEGWAVGHDGLVLHSTDGGKNWAIQLDGLKFTRKRKAESIPLLEEKIKALNADKDAAEKQMDDAQLTSAGGTGAGADAEVDTDADAGPDLSKYEDLIAEIDEKISALEADLEDAKAALSNTVANPLMDVWFRDAKTGFAVGAFGEFLNTQDGGITWTSIADRLDNEDHNHLNAITGKGDLMYIAGEAGHIYRSDDGGLHWSLLDSPDPENGSFFAINVISGDQVFVSGLRGAMYRSVDRGHSWKQVSESLHKNMNSVYFAGNDTVLAVGNDGAFLRSRDGGRTFLPSVRKNRLTVTSVTEAADGAYILVGAGGVEVVTPDSLQNK
ncbi:MAG TPA: YCF48-related protein [Pseudomonadales bacterium]|nr:YCF48-related protein [Pseudomonadales bacterium]